MPTQAPDYRALRLKRGVSLHALARAMQISAPYLLDLERGFRRMTPEMAERHGTALKAVKTSSVL